MRSIRLRKIRRRPRRQFILSKPQRFAYPTVVDLVLEIQAPTLSVYDATIIPTVVDLDLAIQIPTTSFAPLIITPVVANLELQIQNPNRSVNTNVVDLALQINAPTTFYPILLSPTYIDLVFEIPSINKIITPVYTDLTLEILTPVTSPLYIVPVYTDLILEIQAATIYGSGAFFCVDAGIVAETGCVAGLMQVANVQNGKIDCGEGT